MCSQKLLLQNYTSHISLFHIPNKYHTETESKYTGKIVKHSMEVQMYIIL